jgi:hypothetical protein
VPCYSSHNLKPEAILPTNIHPFDNPPTPLSSTLHSGRVPRTSHTPRENKDEMILTRTYIFDCKSAPYRQTHFPVIVPYFVG